MAGVAIGGTKVTSPRSKSITNADTSAFNMTTSITSSEANLVNQPKSDLGLDPNMPDGEVPKIEVEEIDTMVS